jgi:hypothetical protein
VPESDGGDYVLENMLFLCYQCHNYWQEPARTSAELKGRLTEISRKLRDQPKDDSLLSSIFSWPAGQKLGVAFGGGMRIADQERILERRDDQSHPYLTLRIDNIGRLQINADFEDARGGRFAQIIDNVFQIHTGDAWDIVFKRRSIKFEHSDRTVMLQIRQTDDLDLQLTGNLYLNGGLYEITDEQIRDRKFGMTFQDCAMESNGHGLLLSPGKILF